MKARVLETGEWVDVCRKETLNSYKYVEYGTGKIYYADQLALEKDDKLSSYWFDMRNKYAGLAMQAIISDHKGMSNIQNALENRGTDRDNTLQRVVAEQAVNFADALIEGLRKEA